MKSSISLFWETAHTSGFNIFIKTYGNISKLLIIESKEDQLDQTLFFGSLLEHVALQHLIYNHPTFCELLELNQNP